MIDVEYEIAEIVTTCDILVGFVATAIDTMEYLA